MAGLPQGFVIDKQPTTPQVAGLPTGFTVDKPENTVKNIGEGLVKYAGGIPKAVAGAGLLDKPMNSLAQGIGNVARRLGLNVKTPEQITAATTATPFSSYANGSQVGGNPESGVAKGVSNTMNTLELVAGLPALIKGGIKIAGMKSLDKAITAGKVTEKAIKRGGAGKILNLIKEGENASNKVSALSRGGIAKMPSKFSRLWNGTKEVVKPSQKSLDAVATIKKEIIGASSEPQVLYTQISDKIGELSKGLSQQLKNVKIQSQTSKLKGLKNTLTDLYDEVADYSKPTANAIKKVASEIKNAKNADDAWNVAKKLDALIPQSIKQGAGKGGKDALVFGKWRGAREAFNDYIDNVAEGVDDINVKGVFKKISNLYRGKGGIEDNIVQITKPIKGLKDKIVGAGKALAGTAIAGKVLQKMGVFGNGSKE